MTLRDENKAVVRAVLLALDANQLEMLDDHPGYWQTREFMPTLKAAFPDLHHDIQEQIAEGPLVATFSIVAGTIAALFSASQHLSAESDFSISIWIAFPMERSFRTTPSQAGSACSSNGGSFHSTDGVGLS